MKKQIKIAYFPSNTEKTKVLAYNGKTIIINIRITSKL